MIGDAAVFMLMCACLRACVCDCLPGVNLCLYCSVLFCTVFYVCTVSCSVKCIVFIY